MLNWETLKKLMGSKFAQHVILVPIVGWLLVYQNAFAEMFTSALGPDIEIEKSLSWELLVFYLGLVLLGIAASLFRILGPEPIVNHDGIQGYIQDTEAILTRTQFERFCDGIGVDAPCEIKVPAAGVGQVLDATREQWLHLNSAGIRDTLAEHYRVKNNDKLIIRYVVAITFVFGALLTLVPTGATLIWVMGRLF